MSIQVSGTTVINNSRVLQNYRLKTVEISGNTTAATGTNYIATAALTLTMPMSPTVGDIVGFQNSSNTITCIIAGGGSKIMSIAEDMVVDNLHTVVTLQYSGIDRGWVFA